MKHRIIILTLITLSSPLIARNSPTFSLLSNAFSAETATARFSVKKMSCESCQAKMENSLKKLDGIEKLTFDLKKKTLQVTYVPSKVTSAQMMAALEESGFPGIAL